MEIQTFKLVIHYQIMYPYFFKLFVHSFDYVSILQFETIPSTNRGQICLDPHTQLKVTVHFLPTLLSTFYQSALNITDIEHVKKYKV